MKSDLKLWQIAVTVFAAAFVGVKIGMKSKSNDDAVVRVEATASNTNVPTTPATVRQEKVATGEETGGPVDALANIASQVLKQVDQGTLNITKISAEDELKIGSKMHRQRMQKTEAATDDPRVGQIQDIVSRLERWRRTPMADLKLTIEKSPEINAFAGPGGYIYITTGFLEQFPEPAHRAMALAHEIGHIDLLHLRRKIQIAASGQKLLGSIGDVPSALMQAVYTQVSTPYQRDEEFQADKFGLDLALRAGWKKEELIGLLRRMLVIKNRSRSETTSGPWAKAVESLILTHPNFEERLKRLEAE